MTTRGRPRKQVTGETKNIHVAVMLPPAVVEYIDNTGQPRGTFVARLFLERLAKADNLTGRVLGHIRDALY